MTSKVIITAHRGSFPVRPHAHFALRSASRLAMGSAQYSTVTRSNGETVLNEYRDRNEWEEHKRRSSLAHSRVHSKNGPVSGCHCDYCDTCNVT
jgi:hypothetical protein